ncbi:hypothetical protein C8T65DRAFT_720818 [Cerioporus squamosus]|nr:hypothetical protein C8T65DRAFT_720818 [Cerioporus squamosus]
MSMNKITAERNQRILLELATQPGNDICADCKTRNPRWASYNLGIFICVNCASIHRKMGTHISKVKSLTLDTWTKEQVEFMKSMGNLKSNAHYNPDEIRHPPPTNMIDAERDSDLEKYIRSKYQYKSYVPRSAQVAALLGPSRSAADRLSSTSSRSQTMSSSSSASTSTSTSTPSSSKVSASPSLPPTTPASTLSSTNPLRTQSQMRSASQPVVVPATAQTTQQRPATQPPQPQTSSPLWNDLAQLQAPASNSSLPLQYASPATTQPISIPTSNPSGLAVPNQFSKPRHGAFAGAAPRSMSLNTGLSSMNMGMTGASPSMFQPQPSLGGSAPFVPQNATPSPNPYTPQSLPPTGFGLAHDAEPTDAAGISHDSHTANASRLPMFPTQQLGTMQGSPMFPSQTFGQPQQQPQMQMGNPFMQGQPQQAQYGTSAQQFLQQMQPQAQQQQQQQAYGQPNAFGGTGWQQPGFQGQQQWGGM